MSAGQPRDAAGRFGTVGRQEPAVGLQLSQDLVHRVLSDENALDIVADARRRLLESNPSTWDVHPEAVDEILHAAQNAPDEVIAAAVLKVRASRRPPNVHDLDHYLADALRETTASAVADGWHAGRPPSWH